MEFPYIAALMYGYDFHMQFYCDIIRGMEILVIDGQGGGLGRSIIAALKKSIHSSRITAVGTNAMATSAMMKAGADQAATGENPIIVASRNADIIIGPLGIVVADAMLGEITPRMALAIADSRALRLLIPVNQCNNIVVGVRDRSLTEMINEIVEHVVSLETQKGL